MKTAMQELIEEMKANAVAGEMFWIKQPNEFFEKYLEKEKQQIADAFRNGSTSSMLGGGHWTQYYNQNYNQNK